MDLVNPGFGLVFWTAITFLVLLFILRKFAWKPILDAVEERERNINESLEAADLAKTEVMNLQEDNEQMLKEAREQRDQLLRDAQAMKKRLMDEATQEAAKKSAEMITKAQESIRAEKKAAIKELKSQVGLLSLEIAEKVIQSELKDKKTQQALVAKMIEDAQLN